jgi:CubicO group peptidase (beta-lactamase class C family)
MSSGGLSKSRLERVHSVMADHVARGETPGIVSLISRRGELHVDAIGTMAVGGGAPMRRDTIFRIASMTKPIIAAAAMILVEECKLGLDDPVDRLLPELADRRVLKSLESAVDDTVPAQRRITLRDALTFRLGYGMVMAMPGTYPIQTAMDDVGLAAGPPDPAAMPPPDEWIRRLGTLPLLHQPGERWMYNTGSDVLGVLISRAADQPLEAFLRDRIFAPLHMVDTGFSVPAANIHRLPTSYATDPADGSLRVYDEPGGGWSASPAFPSGGGGLVSTVDDYLAFSEMMLNGGKLGHERILSRPAVEVMTTDQLTPDQKAFGGLMPGYWDNHGWGFGVAVVTRRQDVAETVGTYGWDGGLGTIWRADPGEAMTAILLTQASFTSPSPPSIGLDFLTSAYQAIDD